MIDWLRSRPWWVWVIVSGAAIAAAYGAGRYASPTRVVFQTVTEFREVAAKKTEAGPTKKTARVVSETLPGGGRRTTTDYVLERGPVVTLETRATESKTESITTKEWDAPRLTLGVKGGLAIDDLSLTWGAFAGYRVLGPLVLGVDYTRAGNVVQGSAAITF